MLQLRNCNWIHRMAARPSVLTFEARGLEPFADLETQKRIKAQSKMAAESLRSSRCAFMLDESRSTERLAASVCNRKQAWSGSP
jgi:hypothetical protein